MPVRADIIRYMRDGKPAEHKKPVYFCDCGAFGMFGLTVIDGAGKKKRNWFCGWANGQPYCKGKENGTNERSRNDGGGDLHRDQSESPNLFG